MRLGQEFKNSRIQGFRIQDSGVKESGVRIQELNRSGIKELRQVFLSSCNF
jgi:hypothetical protein